MKGQDDSKTICQFCHQLMHEEIYWDHLWDCKIHRMFIKEVFYGYECKLCSFESDGCGMMMRHMKQIHSKQILLNWTTIRNGLKMYRRKEKINGARKYFCKFCPQEKSRDVEMLFHLKELHTNEIREINSNPKNLAIMKGLSNQKSKTIKRRFDKEVGLLRRLHEQSYIKAKQAAAKAQELKNKEKGDTSSKTDENVVASFKSNQMVFEIEGGNDLGVDTSIRNDTNDIEMTEEPEEKEAEMSDAKMFEDFSMT